MKKYLALLLVPVLMFTGCIVEREKKPQRIQISWRLVSLNTVSAFSAGDEGGVKLIGNRYAYVPTEMDRSNVEIEVNVSGNPKKIDLQLATINNYERIADNKILLKTDHAEEGSIKVSTEEIEEVFDYIVYPAVMLSVWGNPKKESAYSFEQGKHVFFEDSDIRFIAPPEDDDEYIYHFKANAAIVPIKTKDFWTDFVQINNLHELEYEEMAFIPDSDNLYCIKTKNGGYAVLRLTAASGFHYNFMYKYSETGIFD